MKQYYTGYILNEETGEYEEFMGMLKGEKGDKGDKGETGEVLVDNSTLVRDTSGTISVPIDGDSIYLDSYDLKIKSKINALFQTSQLTSLWTQLISEDE